MSDELELKSGVAVIPGWRPLRTFTADDLRARGWQRVVATIHNQYAELWEHPDRFGETFTEQQAQRCEQVRDSREWAKEHGQCE